MYSVTGNHRVLRDDVDLCWPTEGADRDRLPDCKRSVSLKTRQMWIGAKQRHIRIRKPLYTREFLVIENDLLIVRGRDDIPQRYITMARGEADGRSACDHQWFSDIMSGC